jgi:hypothetical protein
MHTALTRKPGVNRPLGDLGIDLRTDLNTEWTWSHLAPNKNSGRLLKIQRISKSAENLLASYGLFYTELFTYNV